MSGLQETMNNFLENSKEKTKIPNIMTNVPLLNGNSLKVSMAKLKQVHSLMKELSNKKARYVNERRSQWTLMIMIILIDFSNKYEGN